MICLFTLGMVFAQEGDPMAGGDPVNCEDWVNSPGAFDASGDGKIDLEDCEMAHNMPKGPPPFNEIDANGDGLIDREEARAFFGEDPNFDAEFDRVDSNGDGVVNWTEYDQEVQNQKPPDGEPMGFYCPSCDIHFATQEEMDNHMHEMHSDMMGAGDPVNCEDWVNSPGAFDASGDGKIDLEDCEMAHNMPKGPPPFNEIDANGDGLIDREEARAFFGEDPNFDAEFDRVDSNGDGVVNWTEYDQEVQNQKPPDGEPMGFYCPSCDIHFATQEEMDNHMHEMHSDMMGAGDPVNCEDWVNSPDAHDMNGDGKIDLEDCEAMHNPPKEHFEYGAHTVNNCIAMAEGKPSYWVDADEFATWDNPQCEEVLTNIGWQPQGGN